MIHNLLQRPEYIHVALNHFPLVGLVVALLALVIGVVARNRSTTVTGLALVCLMSLSVWPVYQFGEDAYDRVLSMTDDTGEAYLKQHRELAGRWVFLYYVTAAVAIGGLLAAWKRPAWTTCLALTSLLLGTASVIAGIFIAHSGGEIRHREFRSGPVPATQASLGFRLRHACFSQSQPSTLN